MGRSAENHRRPDAQPPRDTTCSPARNRLATPPAARRAAASQHRRLRRLGSHAFAPALLRLQELLDLQGDGREAAVPEFDGRHVDARDGGGVFHRAHRGAGQHVAVPLRERRPPPPCSARKAPLKAAGRTRTGSCSKPDRASNSAPCSPPCTGEAHPRRARRRTLLLRRRHQLAELVGEQGSPPVLLDDRLLEQEAQ